MINVSLQFVKILGGGQTNSDPLQSPDFPDPKVQAQSTDLNVKLINSTLNFDGVIIKVMRLNSPLI